MLRLGLFGPFSLTDSAGAEIPLKSRKAKGLLAYLALTPGKPRAREQIMALLWSDRAEAQARGSLRQVLTGLRKELGADADALLIDNETVALDPDRITIAPATGEEFLAGFHLNDPAFEDWLRNERLARDAAASPTATDHADPGQTEIAVLPFDNMSTEDAHDHFTDGVTEDIVTELARFDDLTVYAPWSSFHYADDTLTSEQIGHDLEVPHIVEGSVRRSGTRLRITAALFDVNAAKHVWAQRFDRYLGDAFAIQDEVARAVATGVFLKLESEAHDRAARRPAAQRSALDHVRLGERAQQQDWSTHNARTHFEAALVLDPGNARACANLANWHAHSAVMHFVPFDQAHRQTRAYGEKALTLAPRAAANLAELADAYVQVGEYDLARQCLDKAIRHNPNHPTVMVCAAATLPWLGQVDEALTWLGRYLVHDPDWQFAAMEVCLEVYYMAGQFEFAAASTARWSNLPLYLLALSAAAHAQCGRLDEAADLRRRYLAGLPEGQSFEDHVVAAIQCCTRPDLVALWMDGFRKAGFPV